MAATPAKKRKTPTRRNVKRPVCNEQTAKAVVAALKLPISIADAVELAGIARSTYYAWLERANEELARRANNETRPDEQPYVDFLDMVTRAELDTKQALVADIRAAGSPHKVRTVKTVRVPIKNKDGTYLRNADQSLAYASTDTIIETEEHDWRASLELLRRRWHDEWGDRMRAEHTGAGGGPIRMTIPAQSMDAAALAELEAAMVEAGLVDTTEYTTEEESPHE